MAGLSVQTAPTVEPLSPREVKDYLRLPSDDDLSTINILQKAAREYAEIFLGRALLTQTLDLYVDVADPDGNPLREGLTTGPYISTLYNYITLPKPPVQSVTSVITYNDSDTATTFAASKYYVDTAREPSRITLRTGETFPTALRVANAIRVTYVAGYANPASVPEPIKLGLLQHIAYLYEHRGDMYEAGGFPPAVRSLYSPYVIHSGLGGQTLLERGRAVL